jgi:hypothetical protein
MHERSSRSEAVRDEVARGRLIRITVLHGNCTPIRETIKHLCLKISIPKFSYIFKWLLDLLC